MTKEDLKKAVIQYEKEEFLNDTGLENVIPPEEIDFSATGRYEEILLHIYVHKYYINQDLDHEISLEDAARSWKENVFDPIVDEVKNENILVRFPGRTYADLYVWVVRHWDALKQKYGEDFSISDAYKVDWVVAVWRFKANC